MAGETLSSPQPSVAQRFSTPTEEVPGLRRHVVPLLARLGCSAAACHGAKEGQAGFQLSLFGYDWASDHRELVDDGDPPRANWKEPLESAVLQKPTLLEEHEGGKRFDKGGWEYRLLLSWIQARAPGIHRGRSWVEIERLEIHPSEIAFTASGDVQQLQAIAHWTDDTVEDVTPLCRFEMRHDAVAEVSPEGLVKATYPGDTHVVAYYDRAIATVPVYLPRSESDRLTPSVDRQPLTQVDSFIETKLTKLGIRPSDLCSDNEFLRRVSLDLTGTLPTAEEVRQFESDGDPGKRTRKIDELLRRPEYAAWWTTWLCDLMGNSEALMPDGSFRRDESELWYQWIRDRVRDNVPYDQIVQGIISPTGHRPGQTHEDYYREMTSYVQAEEPADFGRRETMPFFWAKTNLRSAKDKTLAFSYVFLGVKLQCAQCHKHPFDRWTKEDFDNFKEFFTRLHFGVAPDAKSSYDKLRQEIVGSTKRGANQLLTRAARAGRTIPWREVYYDQQGGPRTRPFADSSGADRDLTDADPMAALMNWLRDPAHPYLAIAMVNRVWHHYFGVGIVDPPDDLNLANPPSNRPLLDYLAAGFIETGYDLQWLHREIINSDAYQRSWRNNETNVADCRNYSRALLRRLPAEVLHDAVLRATAADQKQAWKDANNSTRLVSVSSGLLRSDVRNKFMARLGKPTRTAVCERERSNEPNLSQAIFLQNDPLLHAMIERPDGWITSVARATTSTAVTDHEAVDSLIQEAYYRTVSRLPTDDELEHCRDFIGNSASVGDGMRGVLWTLLNTKEFCLNR